ncbi:MAG: alpha/beta fold hydrolase [Wolbachia endosymbiont of Tyrophagus putrescentiae]|nr:alpha/beta fold hydrolase [Wolbachia endosymbiont of Tyrophagus putrescentiae]
MYILLHGAWHASWCWSRVTPIIESQGHKVLTLDLSGHDTTLKGITLKTYVDAITTLIKLQNKPVILVGHSMSGVVISQLAENIPEHIEALVYVSGFIPVNNGSLADEEENSIVQNVRKETIIDEKNNKIVLKSSPRIQELFYNTCKEEDAIWAVNKLNAQPFSPFVDKVTLSAERFGAVAKFYIECLKDQAIDIKDQRRMYSKVKPKVFSLDTDHSPFLCAPEALSSILLEQEIIRS